jgi:mono/diheme cytochrome c family protein
MWTRLGIAMLVAFVVGAPAHSQVSATQTVEAESGHTLFVTYCASCHGRSGHGNGPVAEGLRVTPADLSQFAKKNGGMFPKEKTRRIIDGRDVGPHGTFEMPVWGDAFIKREGLSEEAARARIEALVRYLDSIQERSGD